MKTIKQTREDLLRWGKFWQDQQSLGGWATRSTVDRCREILETGVQVSSSLYLHNGGSDNINVPDEVVEIDYIVAKLTQSCRDSLRARYKMRGKGVINALTVGMSVSSYEYFLKRAELEVMKRV